MQKIDKFVQKIPSWSGMLEFDIFIYSFHERKKSSMVNSFWLMDFFALLMQQSNINVGYSNRSLTNIC